MRIESVTVLHYGLSYLPFALESVLGHVDRAVVCYTPHPSHGSRASVGCPEGERELEAAARSMGPKVHWEKVTAFWQEGQHRDYAYSLCDDADLMIVLDADEVWDPDVLERVIKAVADGTARTWRLRFTTPWRSFRWVCRDDMLPERVRDNRGRRATPYGHVPPELGPVWHFGYAVTDDVMRYKLQIHGHRAEWRDKWWEEKWAPWPPVQDVHPTCEGFWNPEPMDAELLPELMRAHPFWDREKIE